MLDACIVQGWFSTVILIFEMLKFWIKGSLKAKLSKSFVLESEVISEKVLKE